MPMTEPSIETVCKDIEYIKDAIDKLNLQISDWQKKAERDYVTRKEFEPVRNLVYGVVGTVGLTIVGALMALLLK
jgi:hypothetical protein